MSDETDTYHTCMQKLSDGTKKLTLFHAKCVQSHSGAKGVPIPKLKCPQCREAKATKTRLEVNAGLTEVNSLLEAEPLPTIPAEELYADAQDQT